jgi:hypothetical protein
MIRKVIEDSCDLYDLNINSYSPISSKAYKGKSSEGNEYFIKTTELYTQEKFKFLYNQGIENILYPLKNRKGEFITRSDSNFYITNFINDFYMLDEIKAVNLSKELNYLHTNTYFKRQLTPLSSRTKMDEIFTYLQYKFSVIEIFVRTIEARDFDEFSIPILKNYSVILDAKKVMAKIQRKIIGNIKEKKSVNYAFIHNNPKLDHLLSSGGNQFLISIEKAKIGIPSLDMAKFYIESEDLNIDLKNLVLTYFSKYDDPFYFDYFCFLVLLYYIKGMVIIDKDYVSSQSFIYTAHAIKTFLELFNLNEENKT